MSQTDSEHGSPRAVVHRRILDVAASNPDASMEAIAEEVTGATTDLVERVFEEYGDPEVLTPACTPTGSPKARSCASSRRYWTTSPVGGCQRVRALRRHH